MNEFKEFVGELLFPSNIKCVVCGDELDGDKKYCICDRCMRLLPFIEGNVCRKCGVPIHDMGKVCMQCKDAGHVFSSNISVFMYLDDMPRLIKGFKFANKKYLGYSLSNFIATKVIESDKNYDIIVPVPLHPTRLKERGYNQSWLLCGTLKQLGLNVRDDVLIKVSNTSPQVGLEREDRLNNLLDAFKVVNKAAVKGKVVLVVDDVYTTGTTLDECAKALLHAGAKKVYCVTLCHA